jgi:hypothetical protein
MRKAIVQFERQQARLLESLNIQAGSCPPIPVWRSKNDTTRRYGHQREWFDEYSNSLLENILSRKGQRCRAE